MKKIKIYRDSVTGKYVTPEYAANNKSTTQSETIVVSEEQIEDVSKENIAKFPHEFIAAGFEVSRHLIIRKKLELL